MAEDEMVGWHHQLNGHEFEQTLGDGEGQGSLACSCPRGHLLLPGPGKETGQECRVRLAISHIMLFMTEDSRMSQPYVLWDHGGLSSQSAWTQRSASAPTHCGVTAQSLTCPHPSLQLFSGHSDSNCLGRLWASRT